jgi:hypothetical protein
MTQKMINSIIIALVFIMFFGILGLVGQIEATYTLSNCEVVEINENIATVEDDRGNQWSFYIDETSELKVGDEVDIVMDNNHTDHTRKDDTIKRVK